MYHPFINFNSGKEFGMFAKHSERHNGLKQWFVVIFWVGIGVSNTKRWLKIGRFSI